MIKLDLSSDVNPTTKGKSNSCVSVASAGSYASSAVNYILHKESSSKNHNHHQENLMISNGRPRRFRSSKMSCRSATGGVGSNHHHHHHHHNHASSVSPCHQLQIPSTVNHSRSAPNYNLSGNASSRSPSPLNTISIPATPTSLVSALNLAERNFFFFLLF